MLVSCNNFLLLWFDINKSLYANVNSKNLNAAKYKGFTVKQL